MHLRHLLRPFTFILVAVALLLTSACTSAYERTDRPAGDWSRAVLLGESNLRQAVALEVDREQQAHMVWIEALSEGEGLHYAQVGRDGQVNVDTPLSINLPQPRTPQLLADQEDNLHLAFISRADGIRILYHTWVDAEGNVTEPTQLSRDGENVVSFHMLPTSGGRIRLLWEGEPQETQVGIYQILLPGGDISSPTHLVPDGAEPFALLDDAPADEVTTTHLVWTERIGYSSRKVHYATLQDNQLDPPSGVHVTTFDFAESATYQPPVVGLDSERVYVIWSVQNLGGGLTPTAADTYYVSFAPGKPAYADPQSLNIPTDHRPNYAAHASPYAIRELAPLTGVVYGTDFINAPAVVKHKQSELPVVVSLMIESASKQFMQLALTVLADGEPVGYQIANETSNASVLPTLSADDGANLHLVWLDTAGFRRYKVYYATTAPNAKAWLNRTTVGDVGQTAATVIWGILSSIGFLPLTLMWNTPALVWLVLFYLFFQQEHLDELGAKIALTVSIVVYLAVKTLFLPGLLSAGTPFVHLVSQETASALTTLIPVLVLLVALTGLFIYLRFRRDEGPPSLLKAHFVFALIDSVLTAVLYAPRFFDPRG